MTILHEKTSVVKGELDAQMTPFLDHLHRGGAVAHWWLGESKESYWFNVHKRPNWPRNWNGNIYFSIHPCTQIPDGDKRYVRSRLAIIAAVNCFFGEFDAKDFTGGKDAIKAHLETLPLRPSAIIDSGGGYHVYWLLAEPVMIDDNNREHIKKLQYAWVDLVGSDQAAKDLARVLRPVGTVNVKPKYAPNFPTVGFVECDLNRLYCLEDFEKLTEHLHQEKPKTVTGEHRTFTGNSGTKYGVKGLMNECDKVAAATNGTRNDTLNKAAFAVGQLVAGGELDGNTAHEALQAAAAVCELPEGEAERTIESGFTAGAMNPRKAPERKPTAQSGGGVVLAAEMLRIAIDAGQPLDDMRAIIARLSDEERRQSIITDQLNKVFKKPAEIEKWLKSCGHSDDRKADRLLKEVRALGYDFALNVLEDEVEVNGKRLTDVTRSEIYLALIDHTKTYVDDAINVLAKENAYHPIQRYLTGLQWDGIDHLRKLLSYIKVDGIKITTEGDGKYMLSHALIVRWLLGCAARGLDGGQSKAFKHQTPVLVFIGGQGAGKSSFVKWLATGVGLEYHQEGAATPGKDEDKRSMVTKWLWEISEMGSSLRKADREAFKGFVTTEWQTYRKPYGRSVITRPTLCNLVGTINNETGFLDDPTGNRRFLPVQVTSIDWVYQSEIDVNQLWAQIVHLYKHGETPELSKEERAALTVVHKRHEVENPLQTYVQMYFSVEPVTGEPNKDTARMHTAAIIERLREFGVSMNANSKVAGKELNDALAPLGLTREFMSIDGVKGWGWYGIRPNGKAPRRFL